MPGIDPVSIGLSAAAEIPKGIVGIMEWSQANKALKNLNSTAFPEYSISPELKNSYGRAEAMAKEGFSSEETNLFKQGVARQQNGAFRSAVDASGGNLSNAISGALQANNLGAQNEFAAKGAQLKAEHVRYADEMGSRIQNQQNLIAEAKMQRRTQLEQAYGAAKKAGIENTVNALTGIATAGFMGNSKIGSGLPTEPLPTDVQ